MHVNRLILKYKILGSIGPIHQNYFLKHGLFVPKNFFSSMGRFICQICIELNSKSNFNCKIFINDHEIHRVSQVTAQVRLKFNTNLDQIMTNTSNNTSVTLRIDE
jgi:hypothetical protein